MSRWYEKPIVLDLKDYFQCDYDTAKDLFNLWMRGYVHGEQGWYQDCDYSSDADWCYGIGGLIRELEEIVEDEEGSVFDVYAGGHAAGLEVYLAANEATQ